MGPETLREAYDSKGQHFRLPGDVKVDIPNESLLETERAKVIEELYAQGFKEIQSGWDAPDAQYIGRKGEPGSKY